jgi:salicylate hydroxylase
MPSSSEQQSDNPEIPSNNFRIAIIGGGIGGLTAALALATFNPSLAASNIIVYEQAPKYSEIGAGVSLGIQAARIFQKLGVWEALDSISGHRSNVHRSNRRWDTDELIVDAPAWSGTDSNEKARQLWLHRAELLEVLYNEISSRGCATLKTDKRVTGVEVYNSIH